MCPDDVLGIGQQHPPRVLGRGDRPHGSASIGQSAARDPQRTTHRHLLGSCDRLAGRIIPAWGAVTEAVLCLFFLVWYSMGGAYPMQTLSLTTMLLIFASLGDVERGFELTIERVTFTVIGIVAAVPLALMLQRWESRRETPSA